MRSGKLDEALARLSEIVDHFASGSMVLFNESFAATNERESAEIASQVVRALVEKGVTVLFLTHTFRLANELWAEGRQDAASLRAERLPDGTRTFRLTERQPLETSFGKDLYHQVFGTLSRPTCGEGEDARGAQLPETAFRGRSPASTST